MQHWERHKWKYLIDKPNKHQSRLSARCSFKTRKTSGSVASHLTVAHNINSDDTAGVQRVALCQHVPTSNFCILPVIIKNQKYKIVIVLIDCHVTT